MQDIKEREFRDSGSIANTEICFEVRATALRPCLHTKGFPLYVHTGLSTKGPPLRNYNTTLGVYYSSLKYNHLYTRGKTQSQNSITSTQEGWVQSQTTITSTQEG